MLIYYEAQEELRCGMAALNHIIQDKKFTTRGLDKIKQVILSETECIDLSEELSSKHVGHYDLSILVKALYQMFDVALEALHKHNDSDLYDGSLMMKANAFLIVDHNEGVDILSNHYVCIIKRYSCWFFMDSMLHHPVLLPSATTTNWLLIKYYRSNNVTVYFCEMMPPTRIMENEGEIDDNGWYSMKDSPILGLAYVQYLISKYSWKLSSNEHVSDIMKTTFDRKNKVIFHGVCYPSTKNTHNMTSSSVHDGITQFLKNQCVDDEEFLFTDHKDNTPFSDIDPELIDDAFIIPDPIGKCKMRGNLFIASVILYPRPNVSHKFLNSIRQVWLAKDAKLDKPGEKPSFLNMRFGDGSSEHSTKDKIMTFGMLKLLLDKQTEGNFEMKHLKSFVEWDNVEKSVDKPSFVVITGIRRRYHGSTFDTDMKSYCLHVRDKSYLGSSHNSKFRCTVVYLPNQNCVFANFLRHKINNSPEPFGKHILDIADNGNNVGDISIFSVIESMVSVTINKEYFQKSHMQGKTKT